ncbi:MAG TPA: RsmG family class I SAM-dependent methyltransferase [Alkalispirochaeta sp.]|nr:RsmG family class I SAM-dependent methyltransferase [Alkalispirochaeta sp.]
MLSHDSVVEGLIDLDVERGAAELLAPVMARYVDELHRNNDRFGLIGREDAADPQRLLSRHILDSIAPWRHVAQLVAESGGRTLYDLGSGAGMPGIPLGYALSAHYPGVLDEVVLVERRSKRVAFLLGVLPGLQRIWAGEYSLAIRAVETDTSNLPAKSGGRHLNGRPREAQPDALRSAVVVFRAYQQTGDALLAELAHVFVPGTPVCALKGKSEHARAELAVLQESSHAERAELHELAIPGEQAERSVLTWYLK